MFHVCKNCHSLLKCGTKINVVCAYVDINDFDDVSASNTELCSAHALLCHTDKRDCCHTVQTSPGRPLGTWHLPNGTTVMSIAEKLNSELLNHDFFARNRDLSVIRLYVSGAPTERGRFRCEIPDANNVTQTLHANICEFNGYLG